MDVCSCVDRVRLEQFDTFESDFSVFSDGYGCKFCQLDIFFNRDHSHFSSPGN